MKFTIVRTITTTNVQEVEAANIDEAMAKVNEFIYANIETKTTDMQGNKTTLTNPIDWHIENSIMDIETEEVLAHD